MLMPVLINHDYVMKLTVPQFTICAHQITKLLSYCTCKPTAALHLQFRIFIAMLYDFK